DPPGPAHHLGIGADLDRPGAGFGGHALKALFRRMQVAAGIIDDDAGHCDSVPLVEGMPLARGSGSTASRRARATALNAASAMWWLLAPSSCATFSVMRAFIATAVQNSRTSSVSKLPIFSVGKSTFHTRK